MGSFPEGSVLDVSWGHWTNQWIRFGRRDLRGNARSIPQRCGWAPAEVRIIRDISREKSIEHKREDMVSMITHDIKNPLTAIIGMSEWLKNDKIKPCLGDDGTSAVEAINRAATRILALSENFLLLSSADGMHRLKKTPAEIGAFLEKVIAEFYLEAAQKGITIRHNLGEVSVRVLVDETQMTRAFSNLINNSLRHTPAGGAITVTAKDIRGYVTVSISDTGPGVSKSDLPHVFEKNYRAYDGKEQIRKTGLGLSIAKAIIEAHGGTIEFVSDKQSAAMFVVRLPLSPKIRAS
jgi:signal transduction histidine kinase